MGKRGDLLIRRIKKHFENMNRRDRRAVVWGLGAVAVIIVYCVLISPLLEDWQMTRFKIDSAKAKLSKLGVGDEAGQTAKMRGLFKTVPCVELPESEVVQRRLFRDKIFEQMKSAGVVAISGPGYVGKVKKQGSFKTLRLKCSAKCSYEQLLKFIGNIKSNPYLLSVEEMKIRCDEKKRNQLSVSFVVSTFVK